MRDTLIRVRDLDPTSDREVLPAWLIAAGSGAGGAAVSATMLVVLAVLGWLTGAGGSESAWTTVSVGLAAWAFAHGAALTVPSGVVDLTPWLLLAWPFLCAWWSAQRVVPDRDARSPSLRGFGGMRRDVASAGGSFVVGYVLVALIAVVLAHLGGARPSVLGTAVGAVLLSALAYASALASAHRGYMSEVAPRLTWAWREYVPRWVARAIRPAVIAWVMTMAAGALVVLAAVALGITSVIDVYARVGGGVVGFALLTLAQLAYLPTLAVWGASWLAGPGFTLGTGTSVTWAASQPGIIPLVPILAAAPAPGPLPAWTPAVVVVPLVIGAGLGLWCVRRTAPTWLDRARLTGVAVLVYGLGMVVMAWAASGPVGGQRYAHVGVDLVTAPVALTAEVGLAAFVVVALSVLRIRRERPAAGAQPAGDDHIAAQARPESD